ncbi:monocarboxylate transporter 13-like [Patiria miniata]|uniref:Major facilitator superfamily (MFS) profile domain-containing protein n=1 Tax=Patiria miniata TaxID=46514 RepID=A0A913ZN92_PATMI|nr:monocarboxylate transporter 13-like [Patiria miniata]
MEFNASGCFIALLAFTNNLIFGCVVKSIGVLLPTLRDQFTAQTWIIGIMVAAMGLMSDVSGLIAVVLEGRFGCRPVLIVSSVVASVGLILVGLASSTIHIALALAVIVGPSFGIIVVLSKVLLGRHFSEHYALACGIGHAGKAVALLAFAPMTQLFLDTYGWRGASLLIGGISMHQIASASVVQVKNPQYQAVTGRGDENLHSDNTTHTNSPKAFYMRIVRAIDLGILLEFNFWIVLMCNFGVTTAFNSWLLYFVPHLQVKGFSPTVAASLCSAAAVGYFLGTIIWGPFIDKGLIKCSTAMIISNLMLSLSFVVDPWMNDVLSYVFSTFVCGMFASAVYTLVDVLTKDVLGIERLVSAFGWMRTFFFARLISGFVPGWIYEKRGSYDLAFIVIGLLPTASLIPLVIGLLRKEI